MEMPKLSGPPMMTLPDAVRVLYNLVNQFSLDAQQMMLAANAGKLQGKIMALDEIDRLRVQADMSATFAVAVATAIDAIHTFDPATVPEEYKAALAARQAKAVVLTD